MGQVESGNNFAFIATLKSRGATSLELVDFGQQRFKLRCLLGGEPYEFYLIDGEGVVLRDDYGYPVRNTVAH